MICPCCDVGTATPLIIDDPIVIHGVSYNTKLKFNLCDYCESEFATPEDVRYNHQQIVDAKASHATQLSKKGQP